MDKIEQNKMKSTAQEGFTYIEVMCAMVILLIGILAQLTALSFSVLRQSESEQQNAARQIASSTLESIFAARDLGKESGISSWEMINTSDVNNNGIFVGGWNPIRESAGKDGIQGTADDSCVSNSQCTVNGYTNSSPLIEGFERKIVITNIQEENSSAVKRRRIEVKVRYIVGQLQREQTLATIIADLPFQK